VSYVWITPKTDWVKTDQFTYQDYNRIRNNLLYLNEQINVTYPNLSRELDLGEEKTGYANDYYPSEFEAFEDALESFKRIGINVNLGERINYKGNNSFIDFASLNRIEKNCLNWKPNINITFTVETEMTPAPDYAEKYTSGYFPDKQITLLYTIKPTPPIGYQVRFTKNFMNPNEVDLLEEQHAQDKGKLVIKFKNQQSLLDSYWIAQNISIYNPEGERIYYKDKAFGRIIRINNFKMPRHFSHSAYTVPLTTVDAYNVIYGGDFTNDSLVLNVGSTYKNVAMFEMTPPAPASLKNRVAGNSGVLEFGEDGKNYYQYSIINKIWGRGTHNDSDKNIKFANNEGVERLATSHKCYVGGQASASGESIGRRMILTNNIAEEWSKDGEVINLPNDIGKKNICCTSAIIINDNGVASEKLCYIMGGNSDGVLSKALYKFDENAKTFEKKRDLPIGIEGGCCYYFRYFRESDMDLYFIVAYGKKGDDWYIYNINKDAWITGGKLPRDFYGGRIAITHDIHVDIPYMYQHSRIYLIGGNSNTAIDGVTNEITFLAYTDDLRARSRDAV
jgi:hypothetical protein